MKGHLRERSPGHWAIIIDLRDPETGKRKRKWHSFRGTKREAQVECARLISEMKGGTYLEPSKVTFAQLLERWLITRNHRFRRGRMNVTARLFARTSSRRSAPSC